MKYAVVDKNGLVLNVIEWEPGTDYSPGDGLSLVREDRVNPGDHYEGKRLVRAHPTVGDPDDWRRSRLTELRAERWSALDEMTRAEAKELMERLTPDVLAARGPEKTFNAR